MTSILPVYQDAKLTNKYRFDQLPFYVLYNIKFRSPLHYHDFAELSLVIDGSGTEVIHGKRHEMRRGTVSFLLPHQIHEIQSNPESPIVLYSCMFDLAILTTTPQNKELTCDLLKSGSELPSFYQLDEETTVVMENIMTSLKQEYESNRYARDSFLRTKLQESLILMMRCHKRDQFPSMPTEHLNKRHSGELVQFIHQHYNEPINLNEISKIFYTSPSTISRNFKQVTGQNMTDYLHSLRINRALSLLSSTEMSVTEISEEVGFQHTRSFSRVFKEIVGKTPREYRQLAK